MKLVVRAILYSCSLYSAYVDFCSSWLLPCQEYGEGIGGVGCCGEVGQVPSAAGVEPSGQVVAGGVVGGEGQVPSAAGVEPSGQVVAGGVVGGEGQVPSAAGVEPSGQVIDVGRLVVEMLLVGKQLPLASGVEPSGQVIDVGRVPGWGIGGEVLVRQLPAASG